MDKEESTIVTGERLSSSLRSWLAGTTGQAALYGLLTALVAVFAWVVWRRIASTLRDRNWAARIEGKRNGSNEHALGI